MPWLGIKARASKITITTALAVLLVAAFTLSASADTEVPSDPLFIFKDSVYAFSYLRVLGTAPVGSADLGEFLTAAKKVKEGDDDSWYKAWCDMGEHLVDLAREFLKDGHQISAREAYFRAYNYYAIANSPLMGNPQDPRVADSFEKGRKYFREAVKLSDGLIRTVEIPYENTALPGYLCLVDKSGRKRPLLITHTGLDGSSEGIYFAIAANALKRGYNCLIFDGPGQGAVIYDQHIPFRPDWEKVVTPVVDFALTLPEVDPDRLALAGFSMGGYLAPRAVAYEHRLKACIADSGVYSVFEGTMSLLSPELQKAIEEDKPEKEVTRLIDKEMEENPAVALFVANMLWTFQTDSHYEVFEKLKEYTLKDCVDQIQCEMLVVNSIHDTTAGSYEQSKKLYKILKSPKTYLEFTDAEGADNHCQMGAVMIAGERILNWLDDRLHPEK